MRDRSQSTIIGFVMVFGIVVMFMLVLQTTAVPTWNQGVEFSHSERVQGELELLRDDIFRTAATGSAGSESISLGTQYPVRPFLLNPGDPSGRLRTTEPRTVTITNATATGEAGDYWDGTPRQFDDRALVYRPDYNEYESAPTTVFENTVLYNRPPARGLPVTSATLINGRRINLVTLAGDLSRSGQGPYSVELRPLSAPQQVTTVRSDGPLVLTARTQLSEETWQELLADERAAAGGFVTNVSVTPGDPGTLRVTLAARESYDLRMARVGVGSGLDAPPAHYITTDSPSTLQLPSGTAELIVFEVRDRYNNPVSGVEVDATLSGPGALAPVENVTDSAGHAVFRYEAVGTGTATVAATFEGGPDPRRRVNVTIKSVQPPGGAANQSLSVEWTAPSAGEDDTYIMDAGVDDTTDLTVTSSPGVEGLDLQYVVSDSAVGAVSPGTGTTDAAGEDTITFTATADGTVDVYAIGGGDADVLTITVTNTSSGGPSNQAPTADFTFEPIGASNNVRLNGSLSADPDGTIVSYEWDIGDDGTIDETGERVMINRNRVPSGTRVRLIVTDGAGATDSTTRVRS